MYFFPSLVSLNFLWEALFGLKPEICILVTVRFGETMVPRIQHVVPVMSRDATVGNERDGKENLTKQSNRAIFCR